MRLNWDISDGLEVGRRVGKRRRERRWVDGEKGDGWMKRKRRGWAEERSYTSCGSVRAFKRVVGMERANM